MSAPIATGAASGLFLLADISGYTGFLQAVGTAHPVDESSSRRCLPPMP